MVALIPSTLSRQACSSNELEIASEIVSKFTMPQQPCGSISLSYSDGIGLTKVGLSVARWMQKEFRLTVGWWTNDASRFGQVAQRNHFEGFDVEIVPLSYTTRQQSKIDLLIIDQLEHCSTDSLLWLDQQLNSQIVLGLSEMRLNPDMLECFDENVEVSFELNVERELAHHDYPERLS